MGSYSENKCRSEALPLSTSAVRALCLTCVRRGAGGAECREPSLVPSNCFSFSSNSPLLRERGKEKTAPEVWLADHEERSAARIPAIPLHGGQVVPNALAADLLEASYCFYGPQKRVHSKSFNIMDCRERILSVKMDFMWFLNAPLLT